MFPFNVPYFSFHYQFHPIMLGKGFEKLGGEMNSDCF